MLPVGSRLVLEFAGPVPEEHKHEYLEFQLSEAISKGKFHTKKDAVGRLWERAKKNDKDLCAAYGQCGRPFDKQTISQ